MKLNTEIVDEFEYKGKNIKVHKDGRQKHYFVYLDKNNKKVILDLSEINKFINSPNSHTTINNNVLDMIEKSVQINDFLFNLKDLKNKLKKYN